ncbi:hypothetical protein ACFYKX_19010 [Cytobacillus sp. FJAT-54145]|uniref:YkoP-like domain-containing protein n=1 Tax=Cytobacillus spartinae TaxID=3299023 RepID=A0ABW6KHI1_9BACI
MRGYLLSIWSILDPIYFMFTRLTYLPSSDEHQNIFRVRLTKYRGRLITLSDGTCINKNDTLVKIHLHNVKLLKELKGIKSEIKKGKIIYEYVLKSLPGIQLYIENHKYSEEIKGIIGITLLNKGCNRLGFETFQLSHPFYRWFKWVSFVPIEMLSSTKLSFRKLFRHDPPSYLVMSKEKLEKMYSLKKEI